ncbi:hypothetical protein TNIN_285641 [Trichonephila inaurata madagascariensis]|uniref:Uncharacterized protein n=1 Tax=Trichonephila inaurata madagascariensis TaxID=2747483 RepID=A0A8X6YF86_9ARAC|nr:hypothetical protein TNIN_285641 [Trichonephila inaurata madagascariensis]
MPAPWGSPVYRNLANNVIAENGVVPILPPTLDHSDEDSDHSKENKVISRGNGVLGTDERKDFIFEKGDFINGSLERVVQLSNDD